MQGPPKFSMASVFWALLIPGYTLTLATIIAIGQYSRNVTIGYRLLLLAATGWIASRLLRRTRNWIWPLLVGIFFVAYSGRVLIEAQGNRLGRPPEAYLLYLWGGVFLPSLGAYMLGRRDRAGRYDVFCFLVVAACFAVVAWRSWGYLLADTLSMRVRGMRGQEQTISPLSLSYMGTACLLVGVWVTARVPGWRLKTCALCAGLAGLIPIYLGSSRGPLVGIALAGTAYVARSVTLGKSRGRAMLSGAVVLFFLTAIISVMVGTGSGATGRLARIESDYEVGATSLSRLGLYEFALTSFLQAPVLGSALEVVPGTYPHNVILEALMSCGLFGFIYIWFLVTGAWRAFLDLHDPLVGWLALLLFIYLTGNMFSGAIWGADITTSLVMYFHGRRVYAVEAERAADAKMHPSRSLERHRRNLRPAVAAVTSLSSQAPLVRRPG